MPVFWNERGWVLETERTAYAFGVNAEGYLVHRYWGARLPSHEDYPAPRESSGWASFNGPGQLLQEEYPAYAGAKYIEPCLKVTFADGVRDTVLQLQRAEEHPDEVRVHLHDTHYPLRVTLVYRIHAAYDLIERFVELTNEGAEPFDVKRMWSAQWHPPADVDYRLSHLSGRWIDEFHLDREVLTPGTKLLESRRLTTSHHHNPWFALDDGTAGEEQGEVWFGLLAWSGNWKLAAEKTDFGHTRISIGLNDWDFSWSLGPGETFVTPSSLGGFTPGGFGAASRVLHDFLREKVVPHPHTTHRVLYNSWEATCFDVDEPSQAKLAERAAAMGVELFVVDDGWFHGRKCDDAGLGDWWPDPVKFPNGLTPLIDRVKALGMEFGVWIEPEMVNPDSDLYRKHPDWVIHFPTRARTPMRNQLILNLARKEVQNYLIKSLDKLLTEHEIRFIKWDMNRNVSEPGWPGAGVDARELWVQYVQGLYHVWGALRERHPKVIFQSCSGGGGRADAGILRLADQIWVSDNTEACARLGIQEGFSQVFPASTMEAWVTDVNPASLSLEFRFHVSMCGVLGIGGDLSKWSDEERAEAARLVSQYKQIRPVLHAGDQFRLRSAQDGAFPAIQYLAKDKSEGVLFAFRTLAPVPASTPPIRLRGLEPEALYQIDGFEEIRSGAAWMHDGLRLELQNFQSTVRRIRRVTTRG
ncbi:MAG: alpha-galactosidase [Anaerolineae bacterium]